MAVVGGPAAGGWAANGTASRARTRGAGRMARSAGGSARVGSLCRPPAAGSTLRPARLRDEGGGRRVRGPGRGDRRPAGWVAGREGLVRRLFHHVQPARGVRLGGRTWRLGVLPGSPERPYYQDADPDDRGR